MKKIFLPTVIGLLIASLFSCSKNSAKTNPLVGNWVVVNDSSLNTNQFYTLVDGDSGISNYNYIGNSCGASFNFNSNGLLSTHYLTCTFGLEGIIDSANFTVKENQVTISIFAQGYASWGIFTYYNPPITRTYTISNLTANTATLTFQSVYSNSEISALESEIINLKK